MLNAAVTVTHIAVPSTLEKVLFIPGRRCFPLICEQAFAVMHAEDPILWVYIPGVVCEPIDIRALPKTLLWTTTSFAGVCWEPLLTASGGGWEPRAGRHET